MRQVQASSGVQSYLLESCSCSRACEAWHDHKNDDVLFEKAAGKSRETAGNSKLHHFAFSAVQEGVPKEWWSIEPRFFQPKAAEKSNWELRLPEGFWVVFSGLQHGSTYALPYLKLQIVARCWVPSIVNLTMVGRGSGLGLCLTPPKLFVSCFGPRTGNPSSCFGRAPLAALLQPQRAAFVTSGCCSPSSMTHRYQDFNYLCSDFAG